MPLLPTTLTNFMSTLLMALASTQLVTENFTPAMDTSSTTTPPLLTLQNITMKIALELQPTIPTQLVPVMVMLLPLSGKNSLMMITGLNKTLSTLETNHGKPS
ncbi:hypothetical protein KCO_22368 [Pectobacterium brasiliense ICMP 19477]|nr:hypothetical protein KCO_22368 [Pectobacterium brasiliense ICMP 19477]